VLREPAKKRGSPLRRERLNAEARGRRDAEGIGGRCCRPMIQRVEPRMGSIFGTHGTDLGNEANNITIKQ